VERNRHDDLLRSVVRDCRAYKAACETTLDGESKQRPRRGDFDQLIVSAATFAVIAARLESGRSIPNGLVASAFARAEKTSETDSAMRNSGRAASEALRTFLETDLADGRVV
jgi:hypothetical protein